jgi:hypothetical protein
MLLATTKVPQMQSQMFYFHTGSNAAYIRVIMIIMEIIIIIIINFIIVIIIIIISKFLT